MLDRSEAPETHATSAGGLISTRVVAIRFLTETINIYTLQRLGSGLLPAWQPGAHIDIHLPGGMVRQYSLVEYDLEPGQYQIAVKREVKGRGGSREAHRLQAGQIVEISPPRNNFALTLGLAPSILFAGGIGITPILSMAHRLRREGRPWTLHYCCRSRDDMPFRAVLEAFSEVHLHYDDENPGRFLDLSKIVAAAPRTAELYCCGPGAMMKAFEAATVNWPPDQVHVEYFANTLPPRNGNGFVVKLARSGHEFLIPEGKTILAVLLENGIPAPHSCEEGICGACEMRVISGEPEHHDMVLTDAEKSGNKSLMICCAGSKSDRLVLDF
jgi:ferredoxin-NADP reductase